MNLKTRLLVSLRKRGEGVVSRRQIAHLGSPSHLSEVLAALVRDGKLARVGAGKYVLLSGKEKAMPINPSREPGRPGLGLGLSPSLGAIFTGLGGSGQAAQPGADRRNQRGGVAAPLVKIEEVDPKTVDVFVAQLARANNVRFRRTMVHDIGDAVSRMAGDDVKIDRMGQTLLALVKQKVIDRREMGHLYAAHLRAKKSVRPVS